MKTLFIIKIILLFALTLGLVSNAVFASETNGTIISGGNNGYAWSDQAGWINFGCSGCGISITDAGVTGYVWSNNFGWINVSPANGGIIIAPNGALSGYAWGSGLGWINFSGVSINSSGKFVGAASGTTIGALSFDCVNCSVTTDFRPHDFRAVAPAQTIIVSGGGGGAPPGLIQNISPEMHSINVPMTILPTQSGTYEQLVSGMRKVMLSVPQAAVSQKTRFIISEEPLAEMNFSLVPPIARLLNGVFYRIVAVDEQNNSVRSFSKSITVTFPVPESLRDAVAGLGVYWWDEAASSWRAIPGAVFDVGGSTVTFDVDHLTLFAIFETEAVSAPEILFIPATVQLFPPSGETIIPETLFSPSAPSPEGTLDIPALFDAETAPTAEELGAARVIGAEAPTALFDVEVIPAPLRTSGALRALAAVAMIFASLVLAWGIAFLLRLRRRRKNMEKVLRNK